MIQLIKGDCLVEMQNIPDKSIDMICADLPYGTTACKYKLRCRINGIVVTSTPEKYNIIWIRKYNPEIYPMDR